MLTEDLAMVVTARRTELRALAPKRRIPDASRRARLGLWLVRTGVRVVPAQERRHLAAAR